MRETGEINVYNKHQGGKESKDRDRRYDEFRVTTDGLRYATLVRSTSFRRDNTLYYIKKVFYNEKQYLDNSSPLFQKNDYMGFFPMATIEREGEDRLPMGAS